MSDNNEPIIVVSLPLDEALSIRAKLITALHESQCEVRSRTIGVAIAQLTTAINKARNK